MAPEIRRLLFFAIFFLCKTQASYSSCKKGCSVLSLFPPEGFNSFADLMIKLSVSFGTENCTGTFEKRTLCIC